MYLGDCYRECVFGCHWFGECQRKKISGDFILIIQQRRFVEGLMVSWERTSGACPCKNLVTVSKVVQYHRLRGTPLRVNGQAANGRTDFEISTGWIRRAVEHWSAISVRPSKRRVR